LVEAERALQGVDGIAIIEFSRRDIVRHLLVQRIIAAYENHRGKRRPPSQKRAGDEAGGE
jgi:phosphate starvation-inducible PhoH-like protein